MNKRSSTPRKPANQPVAKKRNVIIASIFLVLVIVIGIAVSVAVISGTGASNSPPTNNPASTSQPTNLTNQLQIRVEYDGAWKGDYSDSSSDQPINNSWSGNGTTTITVDRPINNLPAWVLSASVKKDDAASQQSSFIDKTLTISILNMDGTVLKTASTSSFNNPVQVTAVIAD